MSEFLNSVLPFGGFKVLAVKSESKGLQHFTYDTSEELDREAKRFSRKGIDVFYAPASFTERSYWDPKTKSKRIRTQANSQHVKSYFLDLDVGEEKAANGSGYKTQEEAVDALDMFCEFHGFPEPTIVSSGSGIHGYWRLDVEITTAEWQPVAGRLKALTQHSRCPLLADPARTSDSASLLRPPGTRNFKDGGKGKPVTVWVESDPVDPEWFEYLINRAAEKYVSRDLIQSQPTAVGVGSAANEVELRQVEEALRHIDPDIERNDWWKILAIIADRYGEGGRDLARRWSSGELHG